MMDTAILAVYFGSADTQSMDLLETALAQAMPGCPVHRAFLSSRYPDAVSIPQALQQLADFRRVLIQPMLVSAGFSYVRIQQLAGSHPVGQPLLANPEAVARAMDNWLPKPLLLMGHGAADLDLTPFAASLPEDVFFAVLEGRPTLDTLLEQLAGRTLHLAPFLLTAGHHTRTDLTLWKKKLEAAGCRVICHTETLAHCSQLRTCLASHLLTLAQGGYACL